MWRQVFKHFLISVKWVKRPDVQNSLSSYQMLVCGLVCQYLSTIVSQDFWNSRARNASGRLEAFHQSLSAPDHSDTRIIWASKGTHGQSRGRHQSYGGPGRPNQAIEHNDCVHNASDLKKWQFQYANLNADFKTHADHWHALYFLLMAFCRKNKK